MKLLKVGIKLLKIFWSAKKFLHNPAPKNIVIFDSSTTKDFSQPLLKDIGYSEINCPNYSETKNDGNPLRKINSIYISPKVIFLMLLETIKGNFKISYYLALIKIINPKIVLTFVDFDFTFSKISKVLDKKYRFISIQSSHRLLFGYPEKSLKKLYLSEYLSFGKFYIDHLNSLNVEVKSYDLVGSLSLATAENFMRVNKQFYINQNSTEKYVCVVAGSMPLSSKVFNKEILKQLSERQIKLWNYVNKFSKEEKILFKLASRYSEDQNIAGNEERAKNEIDVFNKIQGGNKYFIKVPRFKKKFSNYDLIFNSILNIGFHSTMLLESLAKKKKILCVSILDSYSNETLDPLMPEDNISSMQNFSYEKFSNRVKLLLDMPQENYNLIMEKKREYMITYNERKSTSQIIKEKIIKSINS